MHRRARVICGVFGSFTTFVWANRIYNIVAKDGGDGVDLARAIAFVAVGLAVSVVAIGLSRGRLSPASAHRVVTVAGWASIALWGTRIVTIPMGDYSVGFVVVHLVLAAVSISLALWAMGATRSMLGGDRESADVALTNA